MSQPQQPPRAPLGQKFNVAPPTPTAEASTATPPRPASARSAPPQAQDAIMPVPASGADAAPSTAAIPPPATMPPPAAQAPPGEAPVSFNDKLNAADRYWKFKMGFTAALVITGVVGIGTTGWVLSTQASNGATLGYSYGYDSFWALWPSLVTFSVSVVWCLACMAVLVVRKKPVHPGARVALDLLLWLGFIVTVLFAMVALLDAMAWGSYGDLSFGYYASDGDYELASNNTWIWVSDTSYVSSPRNCTRSRSYYYTEYNFASCAEQDAYVNKLWSEKPHRVGVQLTGVVCQFFGLFLHLALFIWACVDTHHYNRSKVSKDAEKIAAGIVQTMIHNGAVIPPPGQAYMRPPMGQGMYYQLPQQAYPMTNMYPPQQQGQQYAVPGQQAQYPMASFSQPAGPTNEKSLGPRYA